MARACACCDLGEGGGQVQPPRNFVIISQLPPTFVVSTSAVGGV